MNILYAMMIGVFGEEAAKIPDLWAEEQNRKLAELLDKQDKEKELTNGLVDRSR